MEFINVGYGNLVSVARIVSVVSPDAAPIKRLVSDAKANGRAIDASSGKATRAVIVCDSDHVVLSALSADEILKRIEEEAASVEVTRAALDKSF